MLLYQIPFPFFVPVFELLLSFNGITNCSALFGIDQKCKFVFSGKNRSFSLFVLPDSVRKVFGDTNIKSGSVLIS